MSELALIIALALAGGGNYTGEKAANPGISYSVKEFNSVDIHKYRGLTMKEVGRGTLLSSQMHSPDKN